MEPALKKRKVGIDKESKTEILKEGDEERETAPKETATKETTTPKETTSNVSDVIERLIKCFRKAGRNSQRRGYYLRNSSIQT